MPGELPIPEPSAALLEEVRARTPARILTGRAGPAYLTSTWLQLRQDHAAALDAVHAELDLVRDLGADFVEQWKLFEVRTQAASKQEYLLRPDRGRRLDPTMRNLITERCPQEADVQIVIGDGLSVAAVITQVPVLLTLLANELAQQGLRMGQPFVVRYCRVGVMNELGELLQPDVVVLLIGERPGLATAESLSAYLGFRPRQQHTDADRNLISNIHARGVLPTSATYRIVGLCRQMIAAQRSGVQLKEELLAKNSSLPNTFRE